MIKYSDNPEPAPAELKEYATALNIVKSIIPMNKPLSEVSINIGLKKARDAGYNYEVLEDAVDEILDILNIL